MSEPKITSEEIILANDEEAEDQVHKDELPGNNENCENAIVISSDMFNIYHILVKAKLDIQSHVNVLKGSFFF